MISIEIEIWKCFGAVIQHLKNYSTSLQSLWKDKLPSNLNSNNDKTEFIYHLPNRRHRSDCFHSFPIPVSPSLSIRHLNRSHGHRSSSRSRHIRHQCHRRCHPIRDRGHLPHSQALCIRAHGYDRDRDAWCVCILCVCDGDVWYELAHGSKHGDASHRQPSTLILLIQATTRRLTEMKRKK